jgi:hypothetical protein
MSNYLQFLLERDAARRRLAEVFELEAVGADHRSTEIATGDKSHAANANLEKNNHRVRPCSRLRTPIRNRERTATPTTKSGKRQRDLTLSSFMLMLTLVGAVVAAQTDRPVFWLLIGPSPFAVLYTARTFLRQRIVRREGLLMFCERNR